MASMLFAERADIQARVLGMPAPHAAAPAAAEHGDGCPHQAAATAHHDATSPQQDGTSDHTAHGIYCSFCLAAGSLAGVAEASAVPAVALASGAVFIPAVAVQPPAANLRLTRHPRDPPLASVLS